MEFLQTFRNKKAEICRPDYGKYIYVIRIRRDFSFILFIKKKQETVDCQQIHQSIL